jgi:ABC-2 type transport system ATP-binding protein
VGLLGHNGAGKTTLLRTLVGLQPAQGELTVLGHQPLAGRVELLREMTYIPDVAVLPRWATVKQLITLMEGMQPRFSADRARALLQRTSVGLGDKVGKLSKGMVVQVHLALVASIESRLMVLDEPTLGLDVMSRQTFYEMLINEWCDGERTVIISTHQVEEVEPLLSDVMILNEGKLILHMGVDEIGERYAPPGGRPALRLVDLFIELTRNPALPRAA